MLCHHVLQLLKQLVGPYLFGRPGVEVWRDIFGKDDDAVDEGLDFYLFGFGKGG